VRILWYSHAPWVASGYGTQTATMLPRIAALGHAVSACGSLSFQSGVVEWNGITVYGGWREQHGNDILSDHYRHVQADLLITLCDPFVLLPDMLRELNVLHWMPVDCTPPNYRDTRVLKNGGGRPVAYSEFGRSQLSEAGFEPLYVPHGIDTATFAPADRAAARQHLGVPVEAFVVGINAANIPRKAYPEQLRAFAAFRQQHPEARLHIHASATEAHGVDLHALADRLHISEAVFLTEPYSYAAGIITPPQMAQWYNSLNVLLATSYGEGFGLPIAEAAACGVPSIVTDCSSMTEVAGPGWKVPGEQVWVSAHRGRWTVPDVPAIAQALEEAHETSDSLAAACRTHALRYDADAVLTEYWKPLLEGLA
jgi:glycosyltransferase involved in cell wall biosynthesis